MKFTLSIFILFISYTLSVGQLKVVTNGDILVSGTSAPSTSAFLDVNVHSTSRNCFQTGSYGLQSAGNTNGFLTHNCYWNSANGGGAVVLREAGAGAISQYFQGNTIFRTVPAGAAGAVVPYVEAMTVQASGKLVLGYPWTANLPNLMSVNGSIGASAFNVVSDIRLKNNISKFKHGLDAVMKLKPITYTYNGGAGIEDREVHVGLAAQNLQEVAPELVKEFEYQDHEIISGMEGITKKVGSAETYLQIKDNQVKYLLVNAIQEQQLIIDDQKAQLDAQAEKLDKLQSQIDAIINGDIQIGEVISVQLTQYDFAELKDNRPNPFNGYTEIDYIIPSESKNAQMNIYNNEGRLIRSIPIQHTGAGTVKLEASQIPSGTYNYSLLVDGKMIETKQMFLAK